MRNTITFHPSEELKRKKPIRWRKAQFNLLENVRNKKGAEIPQDLKKGIKTFLSLIQF